jgi:DNA-binding transcriptional ArsR family regulator
LFFKCLGSSENEISSFEDKGNLMQDQSMRHRSETVAGAAGLSQSALSQRLARLGGDGLVTFRRDAQTLYSHIANPDIARVIAVLRDIYCPELGSGVPGQVRR